MSHSSICRRCSIGCKNKTPFLKLIFFFLNLHYLSKNPTDPKWHTVLTEQLLWQLCKLQVWNVILPGTTSRNFQLLSGCSCMLRSKIVDMPAIGVAFRRFFKNTLNKTICCIQSIFLNTYAFKSAPICVSQTSENYCYVVQIFSEFSHLLQQIIFFQLL
jgi:hypothetical protein